MFFDKYYQDLPLLNNTGFPNNARVGYAFSGQYVHSPNDILQNFNSN